MEDPSLKNETFLAVAERYLEENGSDALEKLIANKQLPTYHDEAGKLTPSQVLQLLFLAPCTRECEGSGSVWEDIKVMEHMAKHEAAETKQGYPIQIEKKTTGVQIKEMVVPADAEEIKLPEITSSKQVQTEWTCAVCQLTTTSEQNLKSHLNGRKHKARCEGLVAPKRRRKYKRGRISNIGFLSPDIVSTKT
ncbi:uncharacterized protein LOC132048781 [Lycium ferocissimum]|uniref:uncharacterized protein LOC132048781 n=1 Tax=Lycium ferocissimum TaxID=112874 RepID=UPI00281532E6|nr:uncharacterized protein LOC132048781 [Lycium ferocissimum]